MLSDLQKDHLLIYRQRTHIFHSLERELLFFWFKMVYCPLHGHNHAQQRKDICITSYQWMLLKLVCKSCNCCTHFALHLLNEWKIMWTDRKRNNKRFNLKAWCQQDYKLVLWASPWKTRALSCLSYTVL